MLAYQILFAQKGAVAGKTIPSDRLEVPKRELPGVTESNFEFPEANPKNGILIISSMGKTTPWWKVSAKTGKRRPGSASH